MSGVKAIDLKLAIIRASNAQRGVRQPRIVLWLPVKDREEAGE